ncbi:MAG TPA: ABC transporter ATP-binding protein [Vicinamibacterales bacterium]
MDPIISVRGLGKQYRIGAQRAAYRTLRESIMRTLSGGVRRRSGEGARTFWALRDVTVDVAPGEVVGIIGRNGAGKSTLLKVLSRITEPTEGEVDLYGRVGCLLEVGTGFHGELTGRDNIFLSGAVLGMRREEINRKFDDIVAFAEVAPFLDTPIKHYSSGMTVRLAFSVAAHLDPEILIIDEVLAVGDAPFQQKCLGRMEDAARQGRTILFVSHNMAAVRGLCRRVLLLEAGRIAMDGDADACINRYLARGTAPGTNQVDVSAVHRRHGYGGLQFQRVTLGAADNRAIVALGRPIDLQMEVRVETAVNDLELSVVVETAEGVRVCECPSSLTLGRIARLEPGAYRLECRIDQNILNPGRYVLTVIAGCGRRVLDEVPDALAFEIAWTRDGAPDSREDLSGLVRVRSTWTAPTPS